ncbi:hypothetical protein [Bradyrhizobium sp. CCGUVB23]|uniref:hypothetical protein n=1 Tax=Bradyrhizobium sp. CCGUVB23 TaxID=2949630 RepID=UPI0020B32E1E|nr:hypothetical protein [Bradyrhizobium sp. CCGUVB23]MCP3468324.1 hypothetical protein [Bradyrhizobium sp. CCGUVB23]
MDPDNFNPFDPFDPGWLQAYYAMLQQQAEPAAPGAVDQVAHEDSEQHLAEERQGGATPIAGGRPPRSNPDYPHLSDNDENLISSALEAGVVRGNLTEGTVRKYAGVLRRLGDHLGARGQAIDAIDHDSLVAHAQEFFSDVSHVGSALTSLRRYRELGPIDVGAAPIAGSRPPRSNPNYPHLSDNDENLINSALEAERGNLTEGTVCVYARALRRLGNRLGARGQTIDALDHVSLVAYADEFFPKDPHVGPALTILRRHREPFSVEDESLIDRAIEAAAGHRDWHSKTARRYNRTLRNLANSLGPSQTITALDHESLLDHAHRVSRCARHLTDLKTALQALREYRGSNTLAERGPPHHSSTAERGHIIDDAARSNQRTATTPSIGLIRESGNSSLGDGASGAVGSWQMGEQAAHSPLQAVDPGELWQEVDQAGQLPADSWDLANFWAGMPSSLSLSQQSSAPAAALPARPPPRDFGYLLPLQFDPSQFNGPQPAPGVLIGALDRAGLLPRPSQWPTNLSINTQPYTASFDSRAWEPAVNNPLGRQVIIQPVHDPGGSSAGGASRPPLADIGPLIRAGWEHGESWLPNHAEPQVASCDQSQLGREANQIAAQVPAGWSSAWPLQSAQSDRNEHGYAHGAQSWSAPSYQASDTRPIGAQDWGGTSGAESMGPSEMPTGFWGRHFEENIVSDPWQHTSTSGSDRHSAAAIGGPPAAHHQAPSQALAGASLPALSVGPLSDTLQAFLARFNAYVGQASGQGLNCLLETVLQLASNTERQDDETPQTQQLQQQAQLLRNSLVQDGTVDPHGEIDLYGAGVGVVLATSFGLRIQAIEAHANGGWTVHPVLGQEGRLVHILHTPGHFQPLWPRH